MRVTTQLQPRKTVQKRHVVEFLQFGIVGGSGFVVNLAATVALAKIFTAAGAQQGSALFPLFVMDKNFRVYHLISTLAFVIANVWNFELNRAWTFRKGGKSSRTRFARYFLIGAVAQIVGLWLLTLLMNPHTIIGLPRDVFDSSTGLRTPLYWSQLIQIVLTMPVSFVLQKLWTFGAQDAPASGEPAGAADALAAPAADTTLG